MQFGPEPDEFGELEAEEMSAGQLLEGDINDMVRRLASAMDGVINPGRDTRMVVAEAMMRLAMGVHVFAAGPEQTRQRLLTMALRTDAGATIN